MQLTKDDVIDFSNKSGIETDVFLDFSKFLEVRKFYEKYKDKPKLLEVDKPGIYDTYVHFLPVGKMYYDCRYRDWLFNHCFVEGLR